MSLERIELSFLPYQGRSLPLTYRLLVLSPGFPPRFSRRKRDVLVCYTIRAWRVNRDLHSAYVLDKHVCSLLTLLTQRLPLESNQDQRVNSSPHIPHLLGRHGDASRNRTYMSFRTPGSGRMSYLCSMASRMKNEMCAHFSQFTAE